MVVMYRAFRDGSDLVWAFYGADLADDELAGFEAFGWAGRWANVPAVYVRGVGGEAMPVLAAQDWLGDRGVEVFRAAG